MQKFEPCWWLPNGHMQTCAATLLKRQIYPTQAECIKLADGDVLELHWLHTANPEAPIILLLHGLEGSVYSNYIQGMLRVAKQHHWRAVVMHLRGSQGRVNAVPQSYHAGKTDDLSATLDHIHHAFPGAKYVAVIGYSLGGNILLKFLGENLEPNIIDTAIAVSLPFDLSATTHYLQKGFRKYYEHRFLRTLKGTIAKKIDLGMNMPVNKDELYKIHTLYDFDNQITAPLHGFKNAKDYYKRSSCKQFLPVIQTNTLIVHAIDDPFVPSDVIPTAKEVSNNVTLNIQRYGGHVGFISTKKGGGIEHWLDHYLSRFLTTLINKHNNI